MNRELSVKWLIQRQAGLTGNKYSHSNILLLGDGWLSITNNLTFSSALFCSIAYLLSILTYSTFTDTDYIWASLVLK